VPAEITQPGPAADIPAPTARPGPAPHAGARALETETSTPTGTETRTGTGPGTAGASAGGTGIASAPGSGRLVTGALPRARHRPAPVYPYEARRLGHTGTSAIRLRIAADGRVREARVHRTAGDAGLDAAALSAVRRWRFEPSPPGVDWTEQWFLVPIEFRLQ
jgi:protein TonB